LLDHSSVSHASPHKRNIQILANPAGQLVDDLTVTRYLCFEIPSLIDAMSLAFSQQKGAMGSQVLDETTPFHSNISGSRLVVGAAERWAATAKARRTYMPLE
jgi:hypothetical protein